jgi:hypothetical protein
MLGDVGYPASPSARPHPRYFLPIEINSARKGPQKADYGFENGAFAGTVRTQKGANLTSIEGERDILKGIRGTLGITIGKGLGLNHARDLRFAKMM